MHLKPRLLSTGISPNIVLVTTTLRFLMRRLAFAAPGLLVLPALLLLSFGRADDKPTAPPAARKIDNFTLTDMDGKEWSLNGLKNKKAIVVVFIGIECPINNAYMPVLAALQKQYADKDVQFLAINSNSQDTPGQIKGHAKEYKLELPVLKDTANVVADKFGAKRTPEAFVLSPGRRGAVSGPHRRSVRHRLQARGSRRAAISSKRSTKCWPARRSARRRPTSQAASFRGAFKPKETGTVTFTKHVAPILQKNCQECHRAGADRADAAGDLRGRRRLVGDDSRSREREAHAAVARRPKHGKFSNDRSLSKEDRDQAARLDRSGLSRRATPRICRAAKKFAEGWTHRQARRGVHDAEAEYTVPAKAEKKAITYQYFTVQTNFTEDRWIQAAEAGRAITRWCITSSSTSHGGDAKRPKGSRGGRHRRRLPRGLCPRRSAAGLSGRHRPRRFPRARRFDVPDALHAQRHRAERIDRRLA